MADFTQALFRIDPTEGLVDYVNTVKPYHTKILDVLVEYVYTEHVNVTVGERWSWAMNFTRPDSNVEYSCGYGYLWDTSGLISPEANPVSRIVSALGKLLIDVSTTAGSSILNIIRNTTGYQVSVGDPVVFQDIPPDLYNPDAIPNPIEYISVGKTYYVVSATPTSIELSDTMGGAPIVIGATAVTQLLPQGLEYNSFLVEPTLDVSAYDCLVTNAASNQVTFVDGYNLTGVDVSTKQWRFAVGTWVAGTGYPASTTTTITLLWNGVGAAPGPGMDATADVVTDATGSIIEVYVTDPGTRTYSVGHVLVNPGAFPGLEFTVAVSELTLPLVENDTIYINGNSTAVSNGAFTVDFVVGSAVTVKESIPPLTTATGTMYTADQFDAIPYWPSGLKVRVNNVTSLPSPLVDTGVYHFIPSNKVGTFSLAYTRYPREFSDYVDITSMGGRFTIERAEPFAPGDVVNVYGTLNQHNNGEYIVSSVISEGSNFRVNVMQNVPHTTPVYANVIPTPSPMPTQPAYDGAMALTSGTYDMPQVCPMIKSPDLYARTFIDENLQFTFHITEHDFIGAAVTENEPYGWGTAAFGSSITSFGSGSEPFPPYAAMTDGLSTASDTHLILPTGFDTQLFDVGAIDETLRVAATLNGTTLYLP